MYSKYKFNLIGSVNNVNNDGKWYKDEGGKNNYLEYKYMIKDCYGNSVDNIDDIKYDLKLVYFDDKTDVTKNILTVLSGNNDSVIRFKINEVSSHHQKRRFSLKIYCKDTKYVGPAYTNSILVLSKRNKKRDKTRCDNKRKLKNKGPKAKKQKLMDTNNNDDSSDNNSIKSYNNYISHFDGNIVGTNNNYNYANNFDYKRDKHGKITQVRHEYKYLERFINTFDDGNRFGGQLSGLIQNIPNNETNIKQDKKPENIRELLSITNDVFRFLGARPIAETFPPSKSGLMANYIYKCEICGARSTNTNNIKHYNYCQNNSTLKKLNVLKNGEITKDNNNLIITKNDNNTILPIIRPNLKSSDINNILKRNTHINIHNNINPNNNSINNNNNTGIYNNIQQHNYFFPNTNAIKGFNAINAINNILTPQNVLNINNPNYNQLNLQKISALNTQNINDLKLPLPNILKKSKK